MLNRGSKIARAQGPRPFDSDRNRGGPTRGALPVTLHGSEPTLRRPACVIQWRGQRNSIVLVRLQGWQTAPQTQRLKSCTWRQTRPA